MDDRGQVYMDLDGTAPLKDLDRMRRELERLERETIEKRIAVAEEAARRLLEDE